MMLACISILSCSKQKSAQEMMKEENKAIDRLINSKDIKILKEYPTDGVFGENEYFHDSNGLYIHVIDSGNGNKAKMYQTVTVRFKAATYFKTDTLSFSTDISSLQPDEFIYGVTASYGTKTTSIRNDQSCSGWAIALSYVSEGAVVNLIIPSALGTPHDRQYYIPIFYESLKFRFY